MQSLPRSTNYQSTAADKGETYPPDALTTAKLALVAGISRTDREFDWLPRCCDAILTINDNAVICFLRIFSALFLQYRQYETDEVLLPLYRREQPASVNLATCHPPDLQHHDLQQAIYLKLSAPSYLQEAIRENIPSKLPTKTASPEKRRPFK